jgi:hypothetical protein
MIAFHITASRDELFRLYNRCRDYIQGEQV